MWQVLDAIVRDDFKCDIGRDNIQPLIYSAADSALVFIVPANRATPAGVIRVARNKGSKIVRDEYRMLSFIKQNATDDFKDTVPLPISLRDINGRYAMSYRFIEGHKLYLDRHNPQDLKEYFVKVREWLIMLQDIPVPLSQIKKSRFEEARRKILSISQGINLGPEMAKAIDTIKEYTIIKNLPPIINHRDILSNIFIYKGRLRVIDWGHANFGYPLLDWVRFICRASLQLYGSNGIINSLRNMGNDRSRISELISSQTSKFIKDADLNSHCVAPLFLLSVFDFLETFYSLEKGEQYVQNASFLLSDGKWLERLMGNER